MTNGTANTTTRPPGVKMTLRVYRVNADGAVIEDDGTLEILGGKEPLPATHGFPPCQCPRHRAGQAVTE